MTPRPTPQNQGAAKGAPTLVFDPANVGTEHSYGYGLTFEGEGWTVAHLRTSERGGMGPEEIGARLALSWNSHDALVEAVVLFLTALPADMGIWRELGLDTSKLTLARMRGLLALSKAEGR